MYDLRYVGGPMHGKHFVSSELVAEVSFAFADPELCVHMEGGHKMRLDKYGVISSVKIRHGAYDFRVALIDGKEVLYFSYRGAN